MAEGRPPTFSEQQAEREARRPLAMLEVLDRAARVLRAALGLKGRCRFEVVVDDEGYVLELWPHAEPGKLTRADLDRLTIPVD